MAKLYLKFEQTVLKEVSLAQGTTTIGRLPDNLLQIDNLAVSGHHAKIYWDQDHYVIEDLGSLNGTYVNNQRVGKASLKDGDSVIIGKHLVQFKEEGQKAPSEKPAEKAGPVTPKLEATVVLDTRKAQEMIAANAAANPASGPLGLSKPAASPSASPSSTGPPTRCSGTPRGLLHALSDPSVSMKRSRNVAIASTALPP